MNPHQISVGSRTCVVSKGSTRMVAGLAQRVHSSLPKGSHGFIHSKVFTEPVICTFTVIDGQTGPFLPLWSLHTGDGSC